MQASLSAEPVLEPKTGSELIRNAALADIMAHPMVQELASTVEYLQGDFKIPYVEKDKVLMSPGVWNNYFYSKDEIAKAFKNTDWNDRYNTSLYYDHEDTRSSEWIGEVRNVRYDEKTGFLFGDLYYFDPNTAIKMAMGKPKSGVSPKVEGTAEGKCMLDFQFKNFSHVVNPAVKTAYINNSEGSEAVVVENVKSESKLETVPKAAGVGEKSEVSSMSGETNPAADSKAIEAKDAGTKVEKKNNVDAGAFMDELMGLLKKYGMMGEPQMGEVAEQSKDAVKESKATEKVPAAVDPTKMSELEKQVQEKEKAIATMSQQIEELNKKLNEPEGKVVVKNSAKRAIGGADENMLSFLQNRAGAGE